MITCHWFCTCDLNELSVIDLAILYNQILYALGFCSYHPWQFIICKYCSIFHNNCTQKHSYKKTPYYPSSLLARLVQVNPLYSILCSRFSFLPCGSIYFFTLVILHDAFLSFWSTTCPFGLYIYINNIYSC